MDFAELAALREANQERGLTESDLPDDPFDLFTAWYRDVIAVGLPEPAAMVLSTVGADARPRARNVLLRGLDPNGFVWFTSYDSEKAAHLDVNPVACLLFSWYAIGRQVLVSGRVERTRSDESDTYWVTRPPGSQLAAWASRQSDAIPGREWLIDRYRTYEREFGDVDIPRPPYWGGYRLHPEGYEFWHGRPMRLHDRFRYSRSGSGWRIDRLAP